MHPRPLPFFVLFVVNVIYRVCCSRFIFFIRTISINSNSDRTLGLSGCASHSIFLTLCTASRFLLQNCSQMVKYVQKLFPAVHFRRHISAVCVNTTFITTSCCDWPAVQRWVKSQGLILALKTDGPTAAPWLRSHPRVLQPLSLVLEWKYHEVKERSERGFTRTRVKSTITLCHYVMTGFIDVGVPW